MCIICAKKANVEIPSDDMIRTMFENNPHGSGLAYYFNGQVHIEKGFMNVDSLLDRIHELDKSIGLKDTSLILHFRISTSGNVDEGNCHPYPLYENKKLRTTRVTCDSAIAHNGVLQEWAPWNKRAVMNDSQMFIRDFLNLLPKYWWYELRYYITVEKAIGFNKLAIIDLRNEIVLLGRFIKDNGLYFSNDSYKPRVIKKPIFDEHQNEIELFDDYFPY